MAFRPAMMSPAARTRERTTVPVLEAQRLGTATERARRRSGETDIVGEEEEKREQMDYLGWGMDLVHFEVGSGCRVRHDGWARAPHIRLIFELDMRGAGNSDIWGPLSGSHFCSRQVTGPSARMYEVGFGRPVADALKPSWKLPAYFLVCVVDKKRLVWPSGEVLSLVKRLVALLSLAQTIKTGRLGKSNPNDFQYTCEILVHHHLCSNFFRPCPQPNTT